MEDYVLALLILIFVVMVLKVTASESKYMPQEISQSYVSFWNPGQDIIDSGQSATMAIASRWTNPLFAASAPKAYKGRSGDHLLPRRDLNWYTWGVGDGSNSAQASTIVVRSSEDDIDIWLNPNYIWGIRKELKIGGGGAVWYLLNNWGDNTTTPTLIVPAVSNEGGVAPTGTLYSPDVIDTFTPPGGTTYVIPNFVILKKSVKNPVAQCSDHSTAVGNLCICDPGWYGTGDDSSKGGNPLGCNQCTPGYWCGGQSNGNGTPPEKGQWTACPINANYSVAGSVQAAACGLKCVSQAGGVPSTAGGTWGGVGNVPTQTADVCYCNPGYEFAVVDDPGGGQRAAKSGVPEGAYKVNQCKECGATGSYGNWSPGGGYYQTGSTSVTTACTACAYGRYKITSTVSSGTYTDTRQYDRTVTCADCPAGSSTTPESQPGAATDCLACSSGRANSSQNATICPFCLAGYEAPNSGQQTCTQCLTGYAASTQGTPSCGICPKGTSALGPGATGCPICTSGTWSQPGWSTCTQWAGSGTLESYLGSSGICPVGTQGISGGSCSTCSAGSYNGSPGGTCANFCPKNTYSPAGASACSTCPAGQSTNNALGSTSCAACPAGKSSNGTGGDCANCPINSISIAGGLCTSCSSGQSTNGVQGSTSCSGCPAGYYTNTNGNCAQCNPGYIITPSTPATSIAACTPCGPGTYASGGNTCATCGAGTFSTGTANQSCSPWTLATAMSPACTGLQTFVLGTTKTADSTCANNCVGSWGVWSGTACPSACSTPASTRLWTHTWTTNTPAQAGGTCPSTATSTAALGAIDACPVINTTSIPGVRTCLTTRYIQTIAGTNGTNANTGDGAAATSAKLSYPRAVALDASGNIYIADTANHCIRKVDTNGFITTVAGIKGTSGNTGDGAAATLAKLSSPVGVAVDASGNIYIADFGNHCIRKVAASNGSITTVAGTNGTNANTGDGAAATSAKLSYPFGVVVDGTGNIYIADTSNHCIRKVDTNGFITTVAGTNGTNGNTGDGAAATLAKLSSPNGVAVDSAGNIYIADTSNQCIRKVAASNGSITTVAGTNGTNANTGDGAAATSAKLSYPRAVALDASGNIYIADTSNHCIRFVRA